MRMYFFSIRIFSVIGLWIISSFFSTETWSTFQNEMVQEEGKKSSPKSSWSEKWSMSEDDGGDDYEDRDEYFYERQGRLEDTLGTIKYILALSEEDRINLAQQPLPSFKNSDGQDYALILGAIAKVPMIERDSVMNRIFPFYLRYSHFKNLHHFSDDDSIESLADIIKVFSSVPSNERESMGMMIEPLLLGSIPKNYSDKPFMSIRRCGQLIQAISKQDVNNRENIMKCVCPLFLEEIPSLEKRQGEYLMKSIGSYSCDNFDFNVVERLIRSIGSLSHEERLYVIQNSVKALNSVYDFLGNPLKRFKTQDKESRTIDVSDDLAVIIDCISKVPPQEQEAVFSLSEILGQKTTWNSYAWLVSAVAKVPTEDRKDVFQCITQFFNKEKQLDTYTVSNLLEVLSQVPKEERKQLFDLAQHFVVLHKRERQATSLANLIANNRRSGFGLGKFIPKESKKFLIKISHLNGNNPEMLEFIDSMENNQKLKESMKDSLFSHLFTVPKDEGNDQNIPRFMKTLSELPKKEREMFFNLTQEFLRRNYEKDALGILEAIAKIPVQERANVIFYASNIFEKGGYYKTSPTSIINGILEIPLKERASVFHLAKDVVKYSKKTDYHDNRIYIATTLAKIPALERENIARHAQALIREEMENIDRISILHALQKIPEDERGSLVKMVNFMITSKKDPDFRFMGDEWGRVAEFLSTIPFKERKPLVDAVVSFMISLQEKKLNDSFDRGSWRETMETFSHIPQYSREEILNCAFPLLTDKMVHQHRLRIISAIANIPEQERKSLLKFATSIYTRAGDLVSIINTLLQLPIEDRSSIVSYTLTFLPKNKENFGFGDPTRILKSIGNIPITERSDILIGISSLTKDEKDLQRISQIIERIAQLKKEERSGIVKSLSLILAHYNHPSIEDINHMIQDITKIPDKQRESQINKKIEEHIESIQPSTEDFMFTHGNPVKKIEDSYKPLTYTIEDAEKAFEKSFDHYLDYILQTSHPFFDQELTALANTLSQGHKGIFEFHDFHCILQYPIYYEILNLLYQIC